MGARRERRSEDPGGGTEPPAEVFVYGTLRSGESRSGLLRGRRERSRLAGVLYDTGHGYPAMVAGGGGWVVGERVRCPAADLARLDAYEGVGEGLYRREALRDEEGVRCWVYVAGPALRSRLGPERLIESGDWLEAGG
jgi:gamma-glutamylcyclotransferase (GGCT)/AIG2-like uncharacterized protein YtfP